MTDTDQRTAEALRAALDADDGAGLVRTVAGFSTPQMGVNRHIHTRTVSALVSRGLLEYIGRGRAKITAAGRDALVRMETTR